MRIPKRFLAGIDLFLGYVWPDPAPAAAPDSSEPRAAVITQSPIDEQSEVDAFTASMEEAAAQVFEPAPAREVIHLAPERQRIYERVHGKADTVLIQRAGVSKVAVIPQTAPVAARLLLWHGLRQPIKAGSKDHGKLGFRASQSGSGALLFDIAGILTADRPEDSELAVCLLKMGLKCEFAPSLYAWARRKKRRIDREMTAFDVPIIPDDRPLYDRMEMGLVIQCIKSKELFQEGQKYVVVLTDHLVPDDELETEQSEAERAAIGLRPVGANQGTGAPLYWPEHGDPMEDFFVMETDLAGIYNPANAFPARYPGLFQQALARIEKAGRPLFDYVKKDMAQAVYYRDLILGHKPRMGKTSNAIEYTELSGVESCLIVTVGNGVQVVAKELRRLGIHDYKILKKLKDIEDPAKYHITSYSWLKHHGKMKKGNSADNYKVDSVRTPAYAWCPHCRAQLVAPVLERIAEDPSSSRQPVYLMAKKGDYKLPREISVPLGTPRLRKVSDYNAVERRRFQKYQVLGGYQCINAECEHRGYTDLDRKQHYICTQQQLDNYRTGPHMSRACQTCGLIHGVQMRNRYKRIRKRYALMIVDEVHAIKSKNSMQSRTIRALTHAKRRISMSGTIMPNHPTDAFLPFSWTFGNSNHKFPFPAGERGMAEFRETYTDTVMLTVEGEQTRRKPIPYIKRPIQFWEWKAPRILARGYDDPEFLASLEKAGLHFPKLTVKPVELIPDPKHALLLFATFQQFEQIYRDYAEEIREQNEAAGTQNVINSARVIAKMSLLRYAATIPGVINDKLRALGKPETYTGSRGGVKMSHVHELMAERTTDNRKVVIFSDHTAMQKHLAEELVYYNPILFNPSWTAEKKAEMFDLFQADNEYQCMICGPRSVTESVDLSRADTVISTDILWSPGMQHQAWSRVLTPRAQPREVMCYLLNVRYSIDSHVYGTFYSKIAAAEQAIHGRVIRKASRGFDVVSFVDQIIAEKDHIREWLIESGQDMELDFLPMLHTLQQLSSREEDLAGAAEITEGTIA